MGSTKKLIRVQHERKHRREGIRPHHGVCCTDDVWALYDTSKRNEEINHRPRLEVRCAVAHHHRRAVDGPSLDRRELPARHCQCRCVVEAGVRAVVVERDVYRRHAARINTYSTSNRKHRREQSAGNDADVYAACVQCRNGFGGVRDEPRYIFASERFHRRARRLHEPQPAPIDFLERDAPAHRGIGELFHVVSTVDG